MNWLFGAHSTWRDILLSLNSEGRTLVLPQSDMPDFVDFLWEVLCSLRSWMGGRWRDLEEGRNENWDWHVKLKKDGFRNEKIQFLVGGSFLFLIILS